MIEMALKRPMFFLRPTADPDAAPDSVVAGVDSDASFVPCCSDMVVDVS